MLGRLGKQAQGLFSPGGSLGATCQRGVGKVGGARSEETRPCQ